jgi:predicted ATPase
LSAILRANLASALKTALLDLARCYRSSSITPAVGDSIGFLRGSLLAMNVDDNSTAHLFLSYASSDRAAVTRIAQTLEGAGLPVWLDVADIPGGTTYGAEIATAIREARAFVLICSTASLQSPNVKQEIMLAWRFRRPMLPLLLDDAPVPDDLLYWLEGRQFIAVHDRPAEEWLARIAAALQHTGAPVSAAPTAFLPPPIPPTNLPVVLSSFVGREREILDVAELVRHERLVTLSGPGGVGKTRLALRAAEEVRDLFTDGVFVVDLAPIEDAALVLGSLVHTLEIPEVNGQSQLEAAHQWIGKKMLLLVLDNFERVRAAAGEIVALQEHCPALHLLVTSRALLRVRGEHEYRVDPLPVPSALPADVDQLLAIPSVELFVERARDARSGFTLTNENKAAVAAICRHLDGLPLAIELAAARLRVLSPQALLERLRDRFALLTHGARNAPTRQQTLRDTIEWSYLLLRPDEQRLLSWLSMFAGGFSFESVEAVCSVPDGPSIDVLDGVEELLETSFLRRVEGGAEDRFAMLETIREYALGRFAMLTEVRAYSLEQLGTHGDEQLAWQSFTDYWSTQAEAFEAELSGPNQRAWLERLRREHDNLRLALEHSLQAGFIETAMRLAGTLWRYWDIRSYLNEGRHWLADVLAASGDQVSGARAKVLNGAGWLARRQGDLTVAQLLYEEHVELAHTLGDPAKVAVALVNLAVVKGVLGDYAEARALLDQALPLTQTTKNRRLEGVAQLYLGLGAYYCGDFERAQERLDVALALFNQLQDTMLAAICHCNLAAVADRQGQFEQAETLATAACQCFTDLDYSLGVLSAQVLLGRFARERGDLARADALGAVALAGAAAADDRPLLAQTLEELALTRGANANLPAAVRLLAAANALRATLHAPLPPVSVADVRAMLDGAHVRLDPAEFSRAWDDGAQQALSELPALSR